MPKQKNQAEHPLFHISLPGLRKQDATTNVGATHQQKIES